MKEYRGTPSFPNDQIIYSYVIRDAICFCLTFHMRQVLPGKFNKRLVPDIVIV